MQSKSSTVDESKTIPLTADLLAKQIRSADLAAMISNVEALAHDQRSKELFDVAGKLIPESNWLQWLADNFRQDSVAATCGMPDPELPLSGVGNTARVIPTAGKSLRFTSSEGDSMLIIDPALLAGYYFVSVLSWRCDDVDPHILAKGTFWPVQQDDIWDQCCEYKVERFVECGKRFERATKPSATNPMVYGEWQIHCEVRTSLSEKLSDGE